MLFVFKYKSLPIGLNIAGFQDLIPDFATLSKKWHDGYIEVMADYGARIEEDYIDLMPILENLYIPAHDYVKPIKKVKLNYV